MSDADEFYAKARDQYTLPPRLRSVIAASRAQLIAGLEDRLAKLRATDDYDYAREYGIEVLGDDAEALCAWGACTLHISPDKSTGAWLIYYNHTDRYIRDDAVTKVFSGEPNP